LLDREEGRLKLVELEYDPSLPGEEGRPGAGGRYRLVSLSLALLVLLFFLILFYPRLFVTIHAGERGVLWSRWTGTQVNEIYLEGIQFVFPWDRMYVYDIRYRVASTKLVLLSSDGLPITVDLTVRYRPADKLLGSLQEEVGQDYLNVIVMPEVATALRKVVSRDTVEDLYQSKFGKIREQMLAEARAETAKRFVILDDVMFSNIELPETVSQAIQHKLKAEQQQEEMKYVITQAEDEARRKIIEAAGVQEQQRLIDSTLSDRMLEYKSIEATNALAASPNSKLIVLGNGRRGAATPPIILNPGEQTASSTRH
jgi:regulator of protease activity HflC (stomatin/prohibitin superfamily)